jgi:hypothetical protein
MIQHVSSERWRRIAGQNRIQAHHLRAALGKQHFNKFAGFNVIVHEQNLQVLEDRDLQQAGLAPPVTRRAGERQAAGR